MITQIHAVDRLAISKDFLLIPTSIVGMILAFEVVDYQLYPLFLSLGIHSLIWRPPRSKARVTSPPWLLFVVVAVHKSYIK